jgi:hypothetical protein
VVWPGGRQRGIGNIPIFAVAAHYRIYPLFSPPAQAGLAATVIGGRTDSRLTPF